MYDFKFILSNFNVKGEFLSAIPYGEGHINQTFLVTMKDGEKELNYILQRINDKIFPVEKLMQNIRLVTEFNRAKILERGGNPDREALSLVYTNDDKTYYFDSVSGGYFRVYIFIADAISYQTVEKPELFYKSAVAFGEFANLLAEFDATKLFEVIPEFHNTVKRFNDFSRSVELDVMDRVKEVKKEIEFVTERQYYCDKIVSLLKSGEMPTRVTHNDTKLNNVMLDSLTGEPVAVIDLDTVMPGSICYDFGDSIRFGCKKALEDEKDLSKVNFDIQLFEQYVKGYMYAVGKSLTEIEKNNLALGAILMTYECGMRFLADYLDGDVYFHIKRKEHNLDRARTQFKLVEDMEKLLPQMNQIVQKYTK